MKFDLKKTQTTKVIQDARSQITPTVQPKYKNTNSAFQGNSGEYMKNLMAKCRTVVGTPSKSNTGFGASNSEQRKVGSLNIDWITRRGKHPLNFLYNNDSYTASYAAYNTLNTVAGTIDQLFDGDVIGEVLSMAQLWPVEVSYALYSNQVDDYLDCLSKFREKFLIKSLVKTSTGSTNIVVVNAVLWVGFEDLNVSINKLSEKPAYDNNSLNWYYCGRYIASPHAERDKIDSDLSENEFDDYSLNDAVSFMDSDLDYYLNSRIYKPIENNHVLGDDKSIDLSYQEFADNYGGALNKTEWLFVVKLLVLSYQMNEYLTALNVQDANSPNFSFVDLGLIETNDMVYITKGISSKMNLEFMTAKQNELKNLNPKAVRDVL